MVLISDEMAKDELTEKARLEFAIREIEQSVNLRFLLRHYLSFCGVLHPTSVFSAEPILNAYNQGIHAAGVELARILTSAAPLLLPALQIEELNDDQSETK